MENVPTIPPPSEVSSTDPLSVSPPMRTGGGGFLVPANLLAPPSIPKKASNLVGRRFGRLLVVAYLGLNKYKTTRWLCLCDCGGVSFCLSGNLRATSSCGCAMTEQRDSTRQQLKGRQFGKLTVVSYAGQIKTGSQFQTVWNCVCDCGREVVIRGSNLLCGVSKSCGCARGERASKQRHAVVPNLIGLRVGRLLVLRKVMHEVRGRIATKWEVQCSCGKIYNTSTYVLTHAKVESCGCARNEMMRTMTGPRSPCWNPELTQEDRDRGRLGTDDYATMLVVKRRIRKRDNFKCVACGDTGVFVHHLEPWAFDRDLRYDPANLVTLCKECHDQFHLLYGKDCTIEDFEEFLEDTQPDAQTTNEGEQNAPS